jgi:hypothetical protein
MAGWLSGWANLFYVGAALHHVSGEVDNFIGTNLICVGNVGIKFTRESKPQPSA